jgi:tetratricopeptide (TPR) repeat protein
MDGLLIILAIACLTMVFLLLWVAVAAVFRFLANALPMRRQTASRRAHPLQGELLDLEITTRTIRQLLACGEIDAKTADSVVQCLEARRRALQPKPIAPVVAPSTLAQLEQLLEGASHPRHLPPERCREALACYRSLNNNQRAALHGRTLLAVARLLDMAGMTSHALNAYRRVLEESTELADRASIALEAARLAVRDERNELARRFLRLALAGVLAEEEYAEAQSLLRRLGGAVQTPAPVTAPQTVGPASRAGPDVPLGSRHLPSGETPVPPSPVETSVVPAAPPRSRRSLANVLAAFMEERNILWGELAGGLLIVGCSIALVITLWHSLEELPYFPFLIFASITAALFGAGEYTLHHWKLETTSRGLLVIALLLAPLNLLVLVDPSLAHGSTALEWTFKAAALLLALGMVRLAGRDLIGAGVLPGPLDRRWLLMLAVVGASGSQLIVPRQLDEVHPILYVVLGCVPVACHLLTCGAVVAGLARIRTANETPSMQLHQANALFVFLGLASFALFVALGFLLSRSVDVAVVLPRLSPPFVLVGVPILAGGLLVRRGLPREQVGPRTAGTALAFIGLALMLSAVALAWPHPLALLLVCLSNAVLLPSADPRSFLRARCCCWSA